MTSTKKAIEIVKASKNKQCALLSISKTIKHLKELKATAAILQQYRFYNEVKFEINKLQK